MLGLELLGSVAEGELEAHLGPFGLHSSPILKRLLAASELATAIADLATASLPCPALQPSWLLLSRLLAHKFDYDARVLSPELLAPHVELLHQLVFKVIERILPAAHLPAIQDQLWLPGSLGCCFLQNFADLTICGPLASCLQV